MGLHEQIKHNITKRDQDFVLAIAKMHVEPSWWERFIPKSFSIYNALDYFKNKMDRYALNGTRINHISRLRVILEPSLEYFLKHHFTGMVEARVENVTIQVDEESKVSIKDYAVIQLNVIVHDSNTGKLKNLTREITVSTLNADSLRMDGNMDCVCMWVAVMFRALTYMWSEHNEEKYARGLLVCFGTESWR